MNAPETAIQNKLVRLVYRRKTMSFRGGEGFLELEPYSNTIVPLSCQGTKLLSLALERG